MLLDLRFPLLRAWLLAMAAVLCWPLAAQAAPAVALYYGERAGLADFRAFDLVVVDPDHHRQHALPAWDGTRFYAYASVTEVQASRAYYADIPPAWKIGRNTAWGSDVIDQSAP
ncbi:MAG: bifunctional glycoside hydrolase 114/ polysaccharide deacetylase family protein, partial [Giesbergeria sp.]